MSNEKLERYHLATKTLVQQIQSTTLPPDFTSEYDITETLVTMRKLFLDAGVRAETLSPKQEAARQQHGMWSAGYCAAASYIWNQLFRMPSGEEIWQIECACFPNKHYWLRNKLDGKIFDITFDQMLNVDIDEYMDYPYYVGQPVPRNQIRATQQAITLAKHMGLDLNKIAAINAAKRGNTPK